MILNSYKLHIFSYHPPLFNFGPYVVEMTYLEPRFLLQQFACVCSVYNLKRHTLGNGLFGISSRCVCSHMGATTHTHTHTNIVTGAFLSLICVTWPFLWEAGTCMAAGRSVSHTRTLYTALKLSWFNVNKDIFYFFSFSFKHFLEVYIYDFTGPWQLNISKN